jgi:phospholipid/cholesterol/gamma-HCH transport system substrate-binding protein
MAKPKTSRRRSMLIGVAVFAVFTAVVYVALTSQHGPPGVTGGYVKVAFSNVGDLNKGDDVRVADVRVGSVSSIALHDGHPVVTLALDGNRSVYRDATAAIGQQSALGQSYVDLHPGTPAAGRLGSHTTIATAAGDGAQDLTNVLNVLDPRTRASLASMLQEVGGGALGHGQDLHGAAAALPAELTDLRAISNALSSNDGHDLNALLGAVHDLSTSFAGQQQQLATLSRHLATTLDALGAGALDATLRAAPNALTSTQRGLAALTQPLTLTAQAMRALRPGAAALGRATPDLRGLLREAVPPLDKVPGVAKAAVPPMQDLTDLLMDARPLAPALREAVGLASTPLGIVAPYSAEVSQFFTYMTSALSGGSANAHYLRVFPVIGTQTLDGILPLRDPLMVTDPYPAPGQAAKDGK